MTASRYQIIDEVAQGGMGVIYRATDTCFGREVALKVLHSRFAPDSAFGRRFAEESRITALLQHPTIPPVHDFGILPDGRPYMAMKLIRGCTLDKLLNKRPHPAAELAAFVGIFEHVCQALAYAHSRMVIHRDVKPANVMVGAFGEVQVMDWGLAKVLSAEPDCLEVCSQEGEDGDTMVGGLLGTPAFMPPEQARGGADTVDKRADVFGLGAILCVILTGQPPYVGDEDQTVEQKAMRGLLGNAFKRLDGCGADADLVDLCHACLAADPEERPRSAEEVADAVAAYMSAVVDRARRAEVERAAAEARAIEERNTRRAVQKHTAEQSRRRKWQGAVAAAGVLVLGLVAAWAWWADAENGKHRAEQARIDAEQLEDLRRQLAAENEAATERERQSRDAHSAEFALRQSEEALLAGDADRAFSSLEWAAERLGDGCCGHLRIRLGQRRGELSMLRDLDRLDELRWMNAGQKDLLAERAEAFKRFGIVPGTTPAPAAGQKVSEAIIRERLFSALDHWLLQTRERDPEVAAALLTILQSADPDPFRHTVRAAIRTNNLARLGELFREPAALEQPAWFAAVMGSFTIVPERELDAKLLARREQVLLGALDRRPGDLGLLMTLAYLYPLNTKEGIAESIRWRQAAVAAHPKTLWVRNCLEQALVMRAELERRVAPPPRDKSK